MSSRSSASRLLARYGPAAVITGASDGIGRAFAERLAGSGFDLVLVARRQPVLDELAEQLQRDHRVTVSVMAVDLATSPGLQRVIRLAHDFPGGLLVAAAGFGTSGPFLASDPETQLNMLDVNCRALLALTLAFGRRFAEHGHGGVVLMSSLVAFQGVPRAAHYAATKAYVQTLAEGLHNELRPLGVDVLASAPGPVQSGFAARANMRLGATITPDKVARASLTALDRRRATTAPGLLSKTLTTSLLPLPRPARVRVMERVMKGMTAHQDQPAAIRKPAGESS